MALELFGQQRLQGIVLSGQFRIHPLVLRDLALDLLQALEVRGTHPAVFRFPVVVGCLADAVLAADLPRLLPRLSLLQNGDDLRLGESASSHITCLKSREAYGFMVKCSMNV